MDIKEVNSVTGTSTRGKHRVRNDYGTLLNGRNFEYMGEDPYLASQMVVPYVQEVQNNGVAVCVKHFALNNEETFRHQTDVDLDDRALYEIYLPAFKAAVQEGGAWSVMAAYNLYRGQYLCSNERLLDDILRGRQWQIRVQGGDSHAGDAYFAQPVDILLVELCAAGEIAGPLAVVDALR